MTNYSESVLRCVVNWAQKSQDCNGNVSCIEENTKELRKCLDIAFPPSTKLEFENDKINYILSTIFFLSNRLAKSIVGLSEIDKEIENIKTEEKVKVTADINKETHSNLEKVLDEILAKYF
ncbi:MAG: hypothetical protein ACTHME_09080 [Candidatus Nitrosocosmicus sp.]